MIKKKNRYNNCFIKRHTPRKMQKKKFIVRILCAEITFVSWKSSCQAFQKKIANSSKSEGIILYQI